MTPQHSINDSINALINFSRELCTSCDFLLFGKRQKRGELVGVERRVERVERARMPFDVEQEHNARCRTTIPCLVQTSIVKGEHSTLSPRLRDAGDVQRTVAVGGHNETEMDSENEIRVAVIARVWRNDDTGREATESGGANAETSGLLNAAQESHRDRTQLAILFNDLPKSQQSKHIPSTRVQLSLGPRRELRCRQLLELVAHVAPFAL